MKCETAYETGNAAMTAVTVAAVRSLVMWVRVAWCIADASRSANGSKIWTSMAAGSWSNLNIWTRVGVLWLSHASLQLGKFVCDKGFESTNG